MNTLELYHYGVKGQKWGVRKTDGKKKIAGENKKELTKIKRKKIKRKKKKIKNASFLFSKSMDAIIGSPACSIGYKAVESYLYVKNYKEY